MTTNYYYRALALPDFSYLHNVHSELHSKLEYLARPTVGSSVQLLEEQLNQELYHRLAGPALDLLSSMNRALDSAMYLSRPYSAIEEHLHDIHNRIADLSRMVSQNEAIESLQRSVTSMAASIQGYSDTLGAIVAQQSVAARMWSPASSMADLTRVLDAIGISFRYTLARYGDYDIENVDIDKAEDELAALQVELKSAVSQQHPMEVLRSIQALLERVVRQTEKGALDKVGFVLVSLLFSVLGNFLTDTIRWGVSQMHPKRDHGVVKEVRRSVKSSPLGHHCDPNLRFVIADVLLVRSGPGQRHDVVGRLYAADAVFLEEIRNRSWSLVEFEDPDGDVALRGWVFSRYLKRPGGLPCKLR